MNDELVDQKNNSYAVKITNIGKNYGSTIALANISFEVYPGEIYGLLGHNGAGKTTTLRILKGMIKPTTGFAEVLGRRVDEETSWVKQHTGYLPEEGSLMGRLTPLELCEYIGGLFGIAPDAARTRASYFFDVFDLSAKKDTLVEKLSKGMKQKLSIICSIIHDPDIVLMDEPLASLDPAAAKTVKDFIRYLSREKNKTILISSHRLEMVEDLCDRIGIIHRGFILDIDTPSAIMTKTNANSLEEAYLAIVPLHDKDESVNGLLSEMNQSADVEAPANEDAKSDSKVSGK